MDAALAKDFQGVARYNRLYPRDEDGLHKQSLWALMAVIISAAIFAALTKANELSIWIRFCDGVNERDPTCSSGKRRFI